MADLVLPSNNLTPGQDNNVNDITAANAAIRDYVNGSGWVNSARIENGTVTDTDLASPNNSVYRTLWQQGVLIGDGNQTGTWVLSGTPGAASGTVGALMDPALNYALFNGFAPTIFYFAAADYAVAGKTQKLRIRATLANNATAWSSVTATVGLYPVTVAGTADSIRVILGTVVSGSTVAFADPAASTVAQSNSGDFTIPSDGAYALGVVLSANITANAATILNCFVQSVYT